MKNICLKSNLNLMIKILYVLGLLGFGLDLVVMSSAACSSTQFECESGQCVPGSWKCDNDKDCKDGTDENNESCSDVLKCSDSEFQCQNKHHCVPNRWKCDGENDCADGSDEDPTMCKTLVRDGCIDNDFACSTLLCIPMGWVCDESPDCPDSKDEQNCRSNFTCTIDQFTCIEETTKKCLPLTWVCDGTPDCANGSDEKACNATCTSNEFTCRNGKCIVSNWRCDGNNDCIDNSDEDNCPPRTCTPGKDFMCKNDSSCILATWRCDGEYDCTDGSDEKGCTAENSTAITSRCGKQEFECADHITCIHSSWVCDVEQDCPDGSDEDEAHCRHVTCRPDQFQCRNLECIPGHLHCSGSPECVDGSDEENCSTPSVVCDRKRQFDCGTGVCIDVEKVCDQRNDCGNWEDEPKDKCGINECDVNNGNCSELCVNTPGGYYCGCKAGFKLVDNYTCDDVNECEIPGTCSQTCTNEKGTFKCECLEGYLRDPKDHTKCKAVEGHASLLFALRHDIRKISLDHLKMTQIVENTRSATALDYMFRTGMIFWSDSHDGKIYKAPIDEGNAKTIVIEDELTTSDGLAIDWIYNHVYWTDAGKKKIAVAELDGKMRKVLIKDGLAEPRSIAVNPLDGWMYWTDWGVTPGRIERAGMDGSRREIIVNTSLKWPNGLTLDLVHNRLYWVDGKMNSISSSNFDGSDRRLILQSTEALAHPFSITTFEDYVYWTDWTNETIFKANKFTGKELTAILPPKSVKNVMSVHVYHAYRQPDGENHCTPLNGRCSHLCLPAPKIGDRSPLISCACPDGLILSSDEQNCAPDPAHNLHHAHHHEDDEEEERREEEENRIDEMTHKSKHNKTISKSYGNSNRLPAELSNEVQAAIPAESGTSKHSETEKYPPTGMSKAETGTVAGIVIGSLSALFVLVIVVVLVLYRHVFAKNGDSMNFDNPVYRKTTTEDHHISIEKNRGFHKTYPATITEEAQEPLTTTNVNEYV